jgi:hypothetical protein
MIASIFKAFLESLNVSQCLLPLLRQSLYHSLIVSIVFLQLLDLLFQLVLLLFTIDELLLQNSNFITQLEFLLRKLGDLFLLYSLVGLLRIFHICTHFFNTFVISLLHVSFLTFLSLNLFFVFF